jgi:hypothetical protein
VLGTGSSGGLSNQANGPQALKQQQLAATVAKISAPAVQRMAAQAAALLKQLQPALAFDEWTAALGNTETGRLPVNMQRDIDALTDPGIAPEPLAAIAALIVLALLVGLWLDQASQYGPDFAVANRFDLLESGKFIALKTIAAYKITAWLLRRAINQPPRDTPACNPCDHESRRSALLIMLTASVQRRRTVHDGRHVRPNISRM